MRDNELISLFVAAASGRNEITLDDGRRINRHGLVGDISVDGMAASELGPEERSALAAELRQVENRAHLDPRTNPIIRIPD